MRWRAIPVMAIAALLAAGCGDDEDETTVTTQETVTEAATAPPETGGPTTPEAGPAAREVKNYPFRSPTGNIGCFIEAKSAGCAVDEGTYEAPPRPESCELEWGRSLGIGPSGPGEFTCVGGILAPPDAAELPYGEAVASGPFRCDSSQEGIECRNEDTGHGFFISRGTARAF